MFPTVTRQLKFQWTLESGEAIMLEDDCPVWGEIPNILEHFPTNCNGLVDVAVGREYSPQWILPSLVDTYIALDGTTENFPLTGETVEKGEAIWVRIRNRGVNPHTITVVVTTVGTEEKG